MLLKNNLIMKKLNKRVIRTTAILTGAIVGSVGTVSATNLFETTDLGSGAELRSDLLSKNAATGLIDNSLVELKCGEGTCGEKSEKKAKKSKEGEHKCGEGKCGEGKSEKKAKKAKSEKTTKTKSGEHKCGEGKCGEATCGGK